MANKICGIETVPPTKLGAGLRKAVFFDRDGTLNKEVNYLYKIEDFVWQPGAVEAVKFCNEQGYLAIVITNQSGVARGMYGEEDIQVLYDWMNEDLAKYGAHLDAIYYCPHHPEGKVLAYRCDCSCRKPKPGMIEYACRRYDIDKANSLMVGDGARDVESAQAAGVKGVLYTGGNLCNLLRQSI